MLVASCGVDVVDVQPRLIDAQMTTQMRGHGSPIGQHLSCIVEEMNVKM